MSRSLALSAQGKLMASWPGTPLDPLGVLRVMNAGGSKPPLLWICNTVTEPKRLAKALGPDQPLVFSRSAHLLIAPGDDPAPYRQTLGDYLIDALSEHFAGARFDAGASCQGSSLLMYVCANAKAAPFEVGCLCLISSPLPFVPTDRPALLIYGHDDPGHDPFRKDREYASARAATLHSHYVRVMIEAQHGGYYDRDVLPKVLELFHRYRVRFSDP